MWRHFLHCYLFIYVLTHFQLKLYKYLYKAEVSEQICLDNPYMLQNLNLQLSWFQLKWLDFAHKTSPNNGKCDHTF